MSKFLENARKVHGERYDYSQVVYSNYKTKVCIICKEHGEFWQTPAAHISHKQGCPKCGIRKQKQVRTHSLEKFVEKAKQIHGDKYDYSLVDYKTSLTKVKIICPTHGVFEQIPASHLQGRGCNACAAFMRQANTRYNVQQFTTLARQIHGDKYDYSSVRYSTSKVKVMIECPKHGTFWQEPNKHLQGQGCPKCNESAGISRSEVELFEFIRSFGLDTQTQTYIDYGGIKRFLDITIPILGLAFEYNGLYWHNEENQPDHRYHLTKQELADYHGFKLIHIFEDDWLHRRTAVEHLIRYQLGVLPSIMARKTKVRKVKKQLVQDFYTAYHVQGFSTQSSQVHYGLFKDDELVACMSFTNHASGRKKLPENHWELIRFASKYRVQGGASKLFQHFIKVHNPVSVLSFSWTHLFGGEMYLQLGFKLDKVLPPDYSYVDKLQLRRLHKSGFQHSKMKVRFKGNYDRNLTERENCANNGFYRIYDCGKKRWLWTAEKQAA